MNTQINYMYRDGTNCKTESNVVFEGEITTEEVQKILSNLGGLKGEEGTQFIPGQVGIPDIQNMLARFPIPTIDHVWHDMGAIEITDDYPTVKGADIHQFVEKFAKTKWDEEIHCLLLGIYEVGDEDDGEID